jgi:hypothetical protein
MRCVQSQKRATKPEPARPAASSRSQSTAAAVATPSCGLSLSDWRSPVIGILERNKHYPPNADQIMMKAPLTLHSLSSGKEGYIRTHRPQFRLGGTRRRNARARSPVSKSFL